MELDAEGRALLEARALAQRLHRNGSNGLVRALNGRLARALVEYAARCGLDIEEIEAEVNSIDDDYKAVDWERAM